MSNDQTPKHEDAILGGQTPLNRGSFVLGGMEQIEKIEKIQDQLANPLHKGQEFYLPGLPKLVAVEMTTAKKKREPDYSSQTLAGHFDISPILVCRYIEPLPLDEDDLPLEMLFISGGTFQMGASNKYHHPVHPVTVPPFLMSRYPITRAQWKAVTALPIAEQYLEPSPLVPSFFEYGKYIDAQIPIIANWYEAVEFCQRLTQHTNRNYSLPTESEWEYGCRAGTETRFWFGDRFYEETLKTIITCDFDVDSEDFYGGRYSRRLTPVNFFNIANPWGLCDMHGNISEWCLDHWHDNYQDAPLDGTAWIDESYKEMRIRRGAADYYNHSGSTSSYIRHSGEYWGNSGFRVVVPFPKPHTSPDSYPQNQDVILGRHSPSPRLTTLGKTASIQTKHIRLDLCENAPLIMVHIPPSEFCMGFCEFDQHNNKNVGGPQHRVKVPEFWISKYPITREQWTALALSDQVDMPLQAYPSQPVLKPQEGLRPKSKTVHVKGDCYSVDHVSWDEAIEFCKRLSQHTGEDYRLPSEAEWEYACLAGRRRSLAYKFSPNRFGLCNLHSSGGHIWEWCADYWHENYIGGPTDGSAWTRGGDSDLRVIRGGYGTDLIAYPSTSEIGDRGDTRFHHAPNDNNGFIGFRVVLASR
ncbi:MAG: formylglycine-generating enzyme family protein [Cyanobacteria bacterium P01_F01_bin.150]